MELYIDDRERNVLPYLEDLSHIAHTNYVVKRMTIGDYALVYNGNILAVIERKTLQDLASSLRDGRSKNVEKLITLRESTACKIFYIIEGPLITNCNKLISNIPYKALQAHIDHLMFRDNIAIINTVNQEHTAQRLFALIVNFQSIKPSLLPITVGLGDDEKLSDKVESCISVNEQILRCLPGIGCLISTILAENNISLQSLYLNQHTAESIARFKYSTGGAIGLAKAEKIVQCKKIIDSSSEISHKIHVRILSTIPLISKQTAEKILSMFSLSDVLNNLTTVELLSNVERSEKNKLGIKAASNILQYLSNNVIDNKLNDTKIIRKPLPKKPQLDYDTTTDNDTDDIWDHIM